MFQYAGDVIPSLGKAMDPASFSVYFARLAPMLLKKVGKNCTPAEKSFGVGSTAECLESLGGHLDPYVDSLLNMFLNMTKDEDEDVRNNAVYGAGELALHGGKVRLPTESNPPEKQSLIVMMAHLLPIHLYGTWVDKFLAVF